MTDHTYNFVIAAIIKDEAWDIAEWIAFHKLQGVGHFYLYDNGSTDETRDRVSAFPSELITLIDFPGKGVQVDAYNHFLKHYGSRSKFCALIDADEYIDGFVDFVVEALIGDRYSGIALNWTSFGSNGHIGRPAGLVLENFDCCATRDNIQNRGIKCIYRTRDITTAEMHICPTVHPIIDLSGAEVPDGTHLLDVTSPQPIVLRHYSVKSFAHFCKKVVRQDALYPYKPAPLSYFTERDTNTIHMPPNERVADQVKGILSELKIPQVAADQEKYNRIAAALIGEVDDDLSSLDLSGSQLFAIGMLSRNAGNEARAASFMAGIEPDFRDFMLRAVEAWDASIRPVPDEAVLAQKENIVELYRVERNAAAILRRLVKILVASGRADEASSIVRIHTPETFSSPNILATLADIAEACDVHYALECYRRAAELSPDSLHHSARHVCLSTGAGMFEEALAAADAFRAKFQRFDANACDAEGIAAMEAGQNDRAISCFTELLESTPNRGIYLYRIGRCLWNAGRYAEAVEKAEAAAQAEPSNDFFRANADNLQNLLHGAKPEHNDPGVNAPVTAIYSKLVDLLWRGKNPFDTFPKSTYAVDTQGWNSDHPYLQRAILEAKPSLVIEIGVWKGGSVMRMAQTLKDNNIDGAVVAIDTWLGSWEHFLTEWRDSLGHVLGYPTLFHTFMANVLSRGLNDFVVPLPLDSVNAYELIKRLDLQPDVIHIDAGHDRESVDKDLRAWWPILKSGGFLIGDDYWADGQHWVEVKEGFDAFFAVNKAASFESMAGKCLVRKP